MFLEILQNSQKITCARVPFWIKLQTKAYKLLKKRPWHRCFPVNFVKFLKYTFFYKTPPLATYVRSYCHSWPSKKLLWPVLAAVTPKYFLELANKGGVTTSEFLYYIRDSAIIFLVQKSRDNLSWELYQLFFVSHLIQTLLLYHFMRFDLNNLKV